MNLLFDKFFSYWAFTWFLLYFFLGHSFHIPSPKLALEIAFLENIVEFIYLISVNLDVLLLFKFLLMLVLFKVIPIYLLRKVPLAIPRDIYILIFVFIVYVIYLYLTGTTLLDVYNETNKSLTEKKNDTPFYKFIDWVFGLFQKEWGH
jgi:hypothetical protein